MTPPIFQDMHVMNPTNGSLRVNTAFPPSPLSLNPSDLDASRDDEEQSILQECWDKSIAKHMDLPDGYQNVHVLMIKWADKIDQLRVRQEVDDLAHVFDSVFRYDVTELELQATNAQLTLDSKVMTWACDHNNPDNLLIVYYAGHGIWDTEHRVLEFAPNNDPNNGVRARWNTVEKSLREVVEADVFGIMDCCYASDINRNIVELSRTYEMLAASHIGEVTPQPGEHSFTRRLIKHLKELVVDSAPGYFTTRSIQERMQREYVNGMSIPPALWSHGSTSRHIRLSKLRPLHERPRRNQAISSHARFLHLGFALEHEAFSEAHIERLAKSLPGLMKDAGAPVVDIKWLGCRRVGGRTFRQLAEYVIKNRESLSAISPAKRAAGEECFDEGGSESPDHGARRGRRKIASEDTLLPQILPTKSYPF